MYQKLVQFDQGYQSHELLSDLELYRRRYGSFFKTACIPPFLKKMKLSIQYFQALVDSFIEILRLKHFMGVRVLLIFHTT